MSANIPKGFLFSTTEAGIKYSDRQDMALILSETEATATGVFTTNRVKASPVVLDRKRLRAHKARAIVLNSGNANACTGRKGMNDAAWMCRAVARHLNIPEAAVLVASTGVIGTPMPMDRVAKGIENLVQTLGKATVEDVARAIMTTDTFPKFISKEISIGRRKGTVLGIAKGAGMIAPAMATMLCFILTDLAIEPMALSQALKDSVAETFNLLTVDGDMSTNDSVIAMANGTVGNKPLGVKGREFKRFKKLLFEVNDTLARMIARDGEGATRLVVVRVKGAKKRADARKAALKIANSLLVKTAIYGNDANWGRIMATLGASGISMKEELVDIAINGVLVAKSGMATGRDEAAAKAMHSEEVVIDIDLHMGSGSERVYTCDLTEGYVRINAEYRT